MDDFYMVRDDFPFFADGVKKWVKMRECMLLPESLVCQIPACHGSFKVNRRKAPYPIETRLPMQTLETLINTTGSSSKGYGQR